MEERWMNWEDAVMREYHMYRLMTRGCGTVESYLEHRKFEDYSPDQLQKVKDVICKYDIRTMKVRGIESSIILDGQMPKK